MAREPLPYRLPPHRIYAMLNRMMTEVYGVDAATDARLDSVEAGNLDPRLDALEALNPVGLLAFSAVAVDAPADLAENVLATIAIPANSLGANGAIRLTSLWSVTNNANVKTLRARLGGVAGTAFLAAPVTASDSLSDQRLIANRNAVAVQIGLPLGTQFGSGGAVLVGAVDTSLAQDLVLTGTKAVAGDLIRLEAYSVEIVS